MKRCRKCGEVRPLDDFAKDAQKKDGRRPSCKECENRAVSDKLMALSPDEWRAHNKRKKDYATKWRQENPEKFARSQRNSTLKSKYGIDIDEFDEFLARQGGGCAICGSPDAGVSGKAHLHVDHNHDTGEVRGLLCQPCNVSLGKMRESPDLLRKAALYLEGGL